MSLCVIVSVTLACLYIFRVMQAQLRAELRENEESLQVVTTLITVYGVLVLKHRRYANVAYAGYDGVLDGS